MAMTAPVGYHLAACQRLHTHPLAIAHGRLTIMHHTTEWKELVSFSPGCNSELLGGLWDASTIFQMTLGLESSRRLQLALNPRK